MSGGGGKTQSTTNTVTQPWSGAIPNLSEALAGAQYAYRNPAPYYPGQTYVGPTAGEMSAWQNKLGYADQVFGGAQAPSFGQATDTLSRGLGQGFGAAGTAGGLDARGAINQSLSGMPDYRGLNYEAMAANAPIMRQFEQDILPGLNSRATFLNNPTGGIKTLNRVLPELGQRMSENALNLYDTERMRALNSRDATAGMVSQMGQGLNRDALASLAMFPTLAEYGQTPGNLSADFAQWGRGFDQSALEDSMNRWNYYSGLPRENAAWYGSQVGPIAGMGGTNITTGSTPAGSKLAGGLGGGIAGFGLAKGIGSYLGVMNPALGLGITGAGALLGSGLLG